MRYDSQYGGSDVSDDTKTNADLYFYLCRSETFRIFEFGYKNLFSERTGYVMHLIFVRLGSALIQKDT